MPFSKYTEERFGHLYVDRSAEYIFIQGGVQRLHQLPPDETKKTMCNSSGEFEFNSLPPGEYHVIAFMVWDQKGVDDNVMKEGGGIMRRITLAADEVREVDMVNF